MSGKYLAPTELATLAEVQALVQPTPFSVTTAHGLTEGDITLTVDDGSLQTIEPGADLRIMAPSNGVAGRKLEIWILGTPGDGCNLDFDPAILRPSMSTLTFPTPLVGGKLYIVLLKYTGTSWLLSTLIGGYGT